MLTRRGICYDLKNSPYKIEGVKYDDHILDFNFSSQYNLDRFNRGKDNHLILFKDKIRRVLNFEVNNVVLLSDIDYYNYIEGRGFYLNIDGREILCKETIKFDGEIKIQ